MFAAVSDVTSIGVIEATEGDAAEWNAFVRNDPEGTFCHLWQWGPQFQESFGHRPRYLVARDGGGKIEGVLPVVEMRSVLGHFLISMPHLNYGGPIGSPDAREALVRRAREIAHAGGVSRLELRSRRSTAPGLAAGRGKVTVVLPLPETVEALWQKTFRAKLRSQVRRAQKEQMEVRFGPDQMEAFYRVFSRNMRDLGTPVLPRSFFAGLTQRFPDEVVFGAVYSEGRPVAAGCGFVGNDEFEMTWASSLREYNAKAPNMLLYSAFMEEMIAREVSAFNFGRCTPGAGTHRFKLQWGGEDEPLHWTGWPAQSSASDEPGAAFQLASRAWQRLPVAVAEAIGPVLAARLPQY